MGTPPVIETGPHKLSYVPPGGTLIELGYFDSEGIKITKKTFKQPLLTDLFGDEEIDKVYTGQGWLVEVTLLEYSTNSVLVAWWDRNAVNYIGRLASSIAGALVIEPVDPEAGGPAQSTTGQPTKKYTFHLALPLGDVTTVLKTGTPPKTLPLAFEIMRDISQSLELEQYVKIENATS